MTIELTFEKKKKNVIRMEGGSGNGMKLITLGKDIWGRCVCVCVSCSELQCVAVSCNELQCVAVCCSVLQCVAVCCSVVG